MSARNISESICSHADGFSICVKSPYTAVPDSDMDDATQTELFQEICQNHSDMAVLCDIIPELDVRILYGIDRKFLADITGNCPGVTMQCHITEMISDLCKTDSDVIALVRNDSDTDIIVLKERKLQLLKQTQADSFELLYIVTKLWKELGFNRMTSKARIRLQGFQNNISFQDSLTQIAGKDRICVL